MKASTKDNQKKRAKKPAIFDSFMQEKLVFAVLVVMLALFALLLNVYRIQKEKSEEYSRIVLSQRQSEYVSRTLTARRGDIYDRNGTRLATSEKVYSMILDPRQMYELENGRSAKRVVVDTVVDALNEYFGYDRGEVRAMIEDHPNSSYVRFKKEIGYDQKQGFEEFMSKQNRDYAASKDTEIRKKRVKGIWFEDEYRRRYPYGSLGCNVIGFASSDGMTGLGGVEQYYNEELNGVNGREYGYLNSDADLEAVVRPAQDGNSLILTIDATIQSIVEKYLAEWKQGGIGSDSAACVVMDPNTGEVLAMASTRNFDLNDPRTTEGFTDDDLYRLGLVEAARVYKRRNPGAITPSEEELARTFPREDILSYGRQNAWNQNWRNLCVSDTYEPGSTQKIFTVAGALEEGVISMHDSWNCEGHVQLSDGVNTWKINCVNRYGHGVLDVTGGITNSCNVVMMNIAFAEKSDTFMKYQRIFGFGDYTGIDLPAEADTSALGFASDDIGRTTLATQSFGQNYNCTMIQMAAAYCSVVNGGYYYEPHVLKEIQNSSGTVLLEKDRLLVRQTVSGQTCEKLKKALYETVESGTGGAAKVAGYKVGGKTGTAQKLPRSAKNYVVSFCGFAPVDDPALVCYVIVDNPHLPGEEAAHSSFASGIFAKIMAEALPAVNIYPAGTSAAEYRAPDVLLPEAEGDSETALGTANAPAETEAETSAPLETRPAATDEYFEGEDDGGQLPDALSSMTG